MVYNTNFLGRTNLIPRKMTRMVGDSNLDLTSFRVFEKNGAKLVIDETSLRFLDGAIVDFKEELISSSFTVLENPHSSQSCSCGASFTPK